MAKRQITFEEYDALELACEEIRKENETTFYDDFRQFDGRVQFPTMEQMQAVQVESNFDKYFEYLFYFYTQDFEEELQNSPEDHHNYMESMAYIRRLMKDQLVFVDPEEDEANDAG